MLSIKKSVLICVLCAVLLGRLPHCVGDVDFVRGLPNRSTPPYIPYIDVGLEHISYWATCEPEAFHHDYVTKGNLLVSVENTWRRAHPGQRASLRQVCLLPNGVPLTRLCEWNQRNRQAVWEPIAHWKRVKCLSNTREKIVTLELNELLNETLAANATNQIHKVENRIIIARRMRTLLQKPNHRMLPADVHFTTQILTTLSSESKDAELSQDVVGICNTLLSSDQQALQISAKQLNATNEFLKTFESYMDNLPEKLVPQTRCGIPLTTSIITRPSEHWNSSAAVRELHTVETIDFSHLGVSAHLTANVSVFFVNPDCAEISGISIYDNKALNGGDKHSAHQLHHESHGNFLYRFVYMNESTADLMRESGVQIATFLPKSLWKHVKRQLGWRQAYVILKVYANDALFVDSSDEPTCRASSKIISISIPGYEGQFPEVLPLVLRNKNFNSAQNKHLSPGTGCGYWNYSTWTYNGVETSSKHLLQEAVILCGTKHLTQFSFLIGGTYKPTDFGDSILISPEHQRVLDIISLIGCSLSLLGLLGIWLTATFFKSWRTMASTKVLLNLCVALTLQMVLFLFVNTDDMSEHLVRGRAYAKCVALGAVMQYSILVLFTWMLIIAFLQFQRYVTVLGIARPQHYILKSAIAAWGFPLVPTLFVAFIDPRSYIPSSYQLRTDTGICYPSGYGLIFGVVLPVTLICIVNLTVFIYVFYSISTTLNQTMARQEKKLVVRQVRLSILLFFLLGLSWIFGIFAFMHAGIIFSYLFCLTATMQGFVLFLYFVVFEEMPRRAWKQLLCSTKTDVNDKKKREMQSMTTTSTGLESGSGQH